jgi:uncharacterized membrane protein YeaQ/YmgE (transglycosylase-associated protein family)
MGIIAWIIVGLVAGAIAKAIMPGDDPGGIIVTMIIGIIGALIAGWIASAAFNMDTTKGFFHVSTWVSAIIGSLILLTVYRLVTGRRMTHR